MVGKKWFFFFLRNMDKSCAKVVHKRRVNSLAYLSSHFACVKIWTNFLNKDKNTLCTNPSVNKTRGRWQKDDPIAHSIIIFSGKDFALLCYLIVQSNATLKYKVNDYCLCKWSDKKVHQAHK